MLSLEFAGGAQTPKPNSCFRPTPHPGPSNSKTQVTSAGCMYRRSTRKRNTNSTRRLSSSRAGEFRIQFRPKSSHPRALFSPLFGRRKGKWSESGGMTTAARPTWAPAKGGQEQGGTRIFGPSQKYSSRDMASQTTLKPRWAPLAKVPNPNPKISTNIGRTSAQVSSIFWSWMIRRW